MGKNTVSRIVLAVLLSSVLTLALNVDPIEAQTREAGVQVGDWATYDVARNYTTNDPSPLVGFPLDFSYLKYFRIEVLSVTGTNITFQTTYSKNGTEMSNVMWTDVSSSLAGPLPFFTAAVLFAGADLTVGDPLLLNFMSPSVNATVMRTCASVEREVNFVVDETASSMIRASPPREAHMTDSKRYMFLDRATGVLVEANNTVVFLRIELGMDYHQLPWGYHYRTETLTQIVMKETSIWSPPVPFWLQWQFDAAVAMVVVVSLVGVVYLLRKRKPRVIAPPPLEDVGKIGSSSS